MQAPPLNLVEFTILGLLLDQSVPAEQLRSTLVHEFEWQRLEKGLFLIIGRMKRRGLLRIGKDLAIGATRTRQQSRYFLTDHGRSMWKHTHALCAALCDRWKCQADEIPTIDVLTLDRPAYEPERRAVRLPDEEEAAAILRACAPEFANIFRAAMLSGECIMALSQLTIDCVEWNAGHIRMPDPSQERCRRVHVSEACYAVIRKASADRRSGHVFVTSSGVAWQEENLRMSWRRLRSKLRLPREVGLPSTRLLKQQRVA